MSDDQTEPASLTLNLAGMRAANLERKAALNRMFGGPTTSSDDGTARERLERLVDADTLAALDDRVLGLVTGENPADTETTPGLLPAIREQQQTEKRALTDTLRRGGPPPAKDEAAPRPSGGFDGGAHPAAPRPPATHDAWLVDTIRTRAADRGARF